MLRISARPYTMLTLRNGYLAIVTIVGLVLVGWGVAALSTFTPPLLFVLLLILAVAAQITATSLIGEDVTVEVSTAVSMAVLVLYGPIAASFVAALAATVTILNTLRRSWPGWPRALERLGFNLGMVAFSMFTAGTLFELTQSWLGANTAVGLVLPWFIAAVVNDQMNLWLLIGILHLQNQVKPRTIWHQHKWAIPINVLVMSLGGGVLSFAVTRFDILGIGIFFLPIVLSAYAFRIYVNQTRHQMERLEDLVAERTNDLKQANQELEELHKTKDAFLAVLTHDMRTPLSSIKAYAGVLGKGNLDEGQQSRISRILLRNQDSLLEIVNNILEIEQLQSGMPIELNCVNFDVAYLAVLVNENLTAQAAEKDILLQYDPDPSSVMIFGDREKIKRVLTNLVSNAIKYTESGGTIVVSCEAQEPYAVINVVDTGYGIPAEELPHIFERFRRVKGHRHIAVGTGLGLAIVKSLVEAHEGTIHVSSQEGEGSTFTVRLPLLADQT